MKGGRNSWYVRDESVVSGPFSREDLQEQRRRGELGWYHEISHDGTSWRSASTIDEALATETGSGSGSSSLVKMVAIGLGVMALLLGLGWIVASGTSAIPGGNSESDAILAVMMLDSQTSREAIGGVDAKESPAAYARAIGVYVSTMRQADMTGCPAEFQVAFKHHLDAWVELRDAVAELPETFLDGLFVGAINGFLFKEMDGGMARMARTVEAASRQVKRTFQDVETIAARYDVVVP